MNEVIAVSPQRKEGNNTDLLPKRKSIRLKCFNYSNNGTYFITICTFNKECILGKVQNDQIELNQIGFIVQQTWLELTKHFNFINHDAFIVMPNHFHALITILNDFIIEPHRACKQKEKDSLSQIIAYFKSEVSKKVKKQLNMENFWQRGYYDHIVRNDMELQNFRNYIVSNPSKWHNDVYYKAFA